MRILHLKEQTKSPLAPRLPCTTNRQYRRDRSRWSRGRPFLRDVEEAEEEVREGLETRVGRWRWCGRPQIQVLLVAMGTYEEWLNHQGLWNNWGTRQNMEMCSQIQNKVFHTHKGVTIERYLPWTTPFPLLRSWSSSCSLLYRVVSEHEHARVSEFKTMLEYEIMLTRVWKSAHREI